MKYDRSKIEGLERLTDRDLALVTGGIYQHNQTDLQFLRLLGDRAKDGGATINLADQILSDPSIT